MAPADNRFIAREYSKCARGSLDLLHTSCRQQRYVSVEDANLFVEGLRKLHRRSELLKTCDALDNRSRGGDLGAQLGAKPKPERSRKKRKGKPTKET